MSTTHSDRTKEIAKLNDELRKAIVRPAKMAELKSRASVMMTVGVQIEFGQKSIIPLLRCIADFDAFTKNNDPHGERDFGAVTVFDQRYFWKIDYYDRTLNNGSEDPADTSKTHRVLTIMLAEEY